MATVQITMFLLLHLLLLISAALVSSQLPNTLSRTQDILVAIEEMQKANYFTFVMLINMAPPDLFQANNNITFLMPNDRTLSRAIIPESDAVNFLLRHTIPSPLLFEHLQHFPTGSLIPTSKPDLMLRVTNYGRRQFFLNNSRLTSPNICTRGSSIRCHGIDGVLQAIIMADNNDPNVVTPSPPPATPAAALPPAPSAHPSPTPPSAGHDSNPLLIPPPAGSNKSNSGRKWGSQWMCIVHLMSFVVFTLIF